MTDPRPPRSRWATLRWIALLVFVVGGIALFGLLVYFSGPEQVFAEIVRMGIMGFLAVVLCVVASMLAWSLSWYSLLRGRGLPPRFAVPCPHCSLGSRSPTSLRRVTSAANQCAPTGSPATRASPWPG